MHKLLNQSQHGFLPMHSITANLLESLGDWNRVYDSGGGSRIVYVDFAKAFDTVSHNRLLFKLSTFGVDGLLYRSIESFLSGRQERVRIGNVLSDMYFVTSGVPQGSVLGPPFL